MSDETPPAEAADSQEAVNYGRPLPPEHTRWKKGQSGNPAGRPKNAGQSIKEAMNAMAAAELTRAELREIIQDDASPTVHVAAARELLLMADPGDLADFEEVMAGKETLADARARGLDTSLLKKIKRKSKRIDYVSGSRDGDTVEIEFECDVELRDRAGEHIDRVLDRTDGRPNQSIKVDASVDPASVPTVAAALLANSDVLAAAFELESRLRDASRSGQPSDAG